MIKNERINKFIILFNVLLCLITVTSCASQGVTSLEQGNKTEVQEVNINQDRTFDVDITMEGGSGKAYIKSPVTVTVKDGKMTATLVCSSKN